MGIYRSASPARRSPNPRRSPSPHRSPSRVESPDARNHKEGSPVPKTVASHGRPVDSRSPSPHRSDADVSHCTAFLAFFFTFRP
jgi:arginine/serine-rich splicing factor 2